MYIYCSNLCLYTDTNIYPLSTCHCIALSSPWLVSLSVTGKSSQVPKKVVQEVEQPVYRPVPHMAMTLEIWLAQSGAIAAAG